MGRDKPWERLCFFSAIQYTAVHRMIMLYHVSISLTKAKIIILCHIIDKGATQSWPLRLTTSFISFQ